MDEWRSLSRVFPDLSAPIQALPDMFTKIASLDMGVIEIKLLALVNGENSVRDMSESSGLPTYDVCQILIGFARSGLIVPPGGPGSLHEDGMTVAETVERAVAALESNETIDKMNPASLGASRRRTNDSPAPDGVQGKGGPSAFPLNLVKAAEPRQD
jgi:hypothetical protein